MEKPFLTAEWRKLILINYVVHPSLLSRYLPYKTELDLFNENCYISLVGFMFLNTRIKGIRIPFHSNFEEINLRFYVKHFDGKNWKIGVIFIREIVPKPAISWLANVLYGENYKCLKMAHLWSDLQDHIDIEYSFGKKKSDHFFKVAATPQPKPMAPDSEEQFIAEHYWGYTKRGSQKTAEYQVAHPSWDIYDVNTFEISVDFEKVYGKDFQLLNGLKPTSVFLAEGSPITVYSAKIIS